MALNKTAAVEIQMDNEKKENMEEERDNRGAASLKSQK
jgi:hypothetical protein